MIGTICGNVQKLIFCSPASIQRRIFSQSKYEGAVPSIHILLSFSFRQSISMQLLSVELSWLHSSRCTKYSVSMLYDKYVLYLNLCSSYLISISDFKYRGNYFGSGSMFELSWHLLFYIITEDIYSYL